MDARLPEYNACPNLAVISQVLGRASAAEAQRSAVVAERPDFLPAWLVLGELYLKYECPLEQERLTLQSETVGRSAVGSAVSRERLYLRLQVFGVAQAILRHPTAAEFVGNTQ
jgi:hypothetical protein